MKRREAGWRSGELTMQPDAVVRRILSVDRHDDAHYFGARLDDQVRRVREPAELPLQCGDKLHLVSDRGRLLRGQRHRAARTHGVGAAHARDREQCCQGYPCPPGPHDLITTTSIRAVTV